MSRSPSLRTMLAAITVAVLLLALLVSGLLVGLTTYLHHTVASIGAAVESVRIAEEAQVELLLLASATDAATRLENERALFAKLDEARGHVTSERETKILAEAEARVRAYAGLAREAWRSPAELREGHQAAFAALEALVSINLDQSRRWQARAAAWDQVTKVVGIGVAALLLPLGIWLPWWLNTRAFEPVFALARVMERFGRGEREARGREEGAAELRAMVARFNEMACALSARREAQMAFLGGVAHDLRTPLSALRMSCSVFRPDRPLPPEALVRSTLELVERQICRLDRMVGDLLDMAKIEAGRLELDLRVQDGRSLVRGVIELFEGNSPLHRLQLALPDEPVQIRCDRLRIEQVLTNLVSNAIKYSPRGGAVEVRLGRRGDEAVIRVTDQGIGMSGAERSRLFEPFRRLGLSGETAPGVGLGLYVVKRIVEAHCGRIEVESAPGNGSSFAVFLPVLADTPRGLVPSA